MLLNRQTQQEEIQVYFNADVIIPYLLQFQYQNTALLIVDLMQRLASKLVPLIAALYQCQFPCLLAVLPHIIQICLRIVILKHTKVINVQQSIQVVIRLALRQAPTMVTEIRQVTQVIIVEVQIIQIITELRIILTNLISKTIVVLTIK